MLVGKFGFARTNKVVKKCNSAFSIDSNKETLGAKLPKMSNALKRCPIYYLLFESNYDLSKIIIDIHNIIIW